MLLPFLLAPHAASISELSWYNSTGRIVAAFNALAFTCNFTINPALGGVDWEGGRVHGIRLTNSASSHGGRRKILINFATHGRDYALPDLALRLTHQLCDGSAKSSAILDSLDILLIPILNVPGRERVEEQLDSSTCGDLRKNGNLVDINANFDPDWVFGNDDSNAVDYRGNLASSEAETKLLKAVQRSFAPSVFVDVHASDSVGLTFPHWLTYSDPASVEALRQYLTPVKDKMCSPSAHEGTNECPKVGSAARATLPPGKQFGTALDWFHDQGVLSFAWLTYAGSQVPDVLSIDAVGKTSLYANAEGRGSDGESRRSDREMGAPTMLPVAETKSSADAALLLKGELARGALYDPIYDCIKYYAPISEPVYEAWVARWLGAFDTFLSQFVSIGHTTGTDAKLKLDQMSATRTGSSTSSS
ncbi:hypothetical protein AB1Y20_000392 [Prymnesium parvum]|uniref:Peptidase M14 domain-containing protein n=1 Tax=Prymnesium parvum TaxID=97485 RepID=A0AB34K5Q5_PRYPA|mmetsp:Transcript_519/g.1428  ORF Transcript_519/g.1428 Transcript_519/m.1428 type:complete len:419 (+) Transcript_519:82-1338(+)